MQINTIRWRNRGAQTLPANVDPGRHRQKFQITKPVRKETVSRNGRQRGFHVHIFSKMSCVRKTEGERSQRARCRAEEGADSRYDKREKERERKGREEGKRESSKLLRSE